MKMKNLVAFAALALGALAAPFAAFGTTGDIFEIRPVEGSGMTPLIMIAPYLSGS